MRAGEIYLAAIKAKKAQIIVPNPSRRLICPTLKKLSSNHNWRKFAHKPTLIAKNADITKMRFSFLWDKNLGKILPRGQNIFNWNIVRFNTGQVNYNNPTPVLN